MAKKNRAAQALGRKRWKGVSKADRSAAMREVVLARWRKRNSGSVTPRPLDN